MPFSVKPILDPYKNKTNEQRVVLQVIYNKLKVYVPTEIKINESNWASGKIVKHPKKDDYNNAIQKDTSIIRDKLFDATRKKTLTKDELSELVKGNGSSELVTTFIEQVIEHNRGKFSNDRLKHYNSFSNKIEDYSPGLTFSQINIDFLQKFETWLRKGRAINTVHSVMQMFISVMNKARVKGLIEREAYENYKAPPSVQKLPTYISEQDMDKIKALIDLIEKPSYKLAGYYFLLSCLTGYRISDAKRFDMNMIEGDQIILRAGKNNNIISIPIYPKLRQIINFIQDKPLTLSEQKVRMYVKEICLLVGIKKDINYHASRHSFAMMLMDKGFSIDEVAVCLGDTPKIAQVYARVSNKRLSEEVMKRLG